MSYPLPTQHLTLVRVKVNFSRLGSEQRIHAMGKKHEDFVKHSTKKKMLTS